MVWRLTCLYIAYQTSSRSDSACASLSIDPEHLIMITPAPSFPHHQPRVSSLSAYRKLDILLTKHRGFCRSGWPH
ncbi:hypothetical protein P692DRAFT_20837614 [Suillus brevipes Sb2]|nr:hypothetical protein P692DRAFT_20837614 [Suillus brevipes Sb2]